MKKVLIITYYWPPAGGPGVQRVLKFAKYLPEFGWQPIILTVEKGNFPSTDESLIKEIPSDCKVYKTNIFEPFEIYKSLIGKKSGEPIPTFVLSKTKNESLLDKLIRWIRANVFVPDAKIGWKKFIISEGEKIIAAEKPDLIFSSSPPHSLQLGAMELARRSRLPWVADFRDPWTNAFWQSDIKRISFAVRQDKRLEKRVVSSCNVLITVSETIKNEFQNISQVNCHSIPNGYDESDFPERKTINENFTIRYTGTLGKDQSILGFVNSLEKIPINILDRIRVEFFGSFHSSISEVIASSKVRELFVMKNAISHHMSVELINNADLLLLIIPNTTNNKGIVTGKIFEYLATKNPILGFGPIDGDAEKILRQTKCGEMFEFSADVSKYIIEHYDRWESGIAFAPDEIAIKQFSRKSLTKKLAEVFSELT